MLHLMNLITAVCLAPLASFIVVVAYSIFTAIIFKHDLFEIHFNITMFTPFAIFFSYFAIIFIGLPTHFLLVATAHNTILNHALSGGLFGLLLQALLTGTNKEAWLVFFVYSPLYGGAGFLIAAVFGAIVYS